MGWSKTMIEKQRVPGSSPTWKRKEFFQPCCDPQLIGNSWPGTRVTWGGVPTADAENSASSRVSREP